jgi:hypothetical protein
MAVDKITAADAKNMFNRARQKREESAMDFRKRLLVIVKKYRCFLPLTDSQVAAEFLIRINNFELVETLCKDND